MASEEAEVKTKMFCNIHVLLMPSVSLHAIPVHCVVPHYQFLINAGAICYRKCAITSRQ